MVDDDAMRWPLMRPPNRLVLIGIGSSFYAAGVAALRLRVAGINAVAENSAAESIGPIGEDDTVIGISAGGESIETIRLFGASAGGRSIALTNQAASSIARLAGATMEMHAGAERGGIACRTYVHTLIALLALEQQLTSASFDLAGVLRRAADAIDSLLARSDQWLATAVELLAGPNGTWLLAPLERVSSALQGALMLREGPRRPGVGCETGDWSHVHVYLTATLDYRALVVPGSRWDEQAAEWMTERRSTIVSVGAPFPGARLVVDYPGSDDPLVALLTETTVAELVAASLWLGDAGR